MGHNPGHTMQWCFAHRARTSPRSAFMAAALPVPSGWFLEPGNVSVVAQRCSLGFTLASAPG